MRRLFIVGVGRSGTSLLQSMMAAHPRITMLPETGFLRRYCVPGATFPREDIASLTNRDYRLRRISAPIWERLVAGIPPSPDGRVSAWEIYNAMVSDPGADGPDGLADLIADKDPRLIEYVPLLSRVFPDATIIHMIRDPRDVLLSKQKAQWSADRTWWTNLAAGHIQLALADRYLREFPSDRVLTVRYEALIQEPEATLRVVCDRCGVDYHRGMLDFAGAAKRLGGGEIEPWKRETLGPLLSGNTGKWASGLSPVQIAATEGVMRPWMARNGYVVSKRPSLWALVIGAGLRIGTYLYRSHRDRSIRTARRVRALRAYRARPSNVLFNTVRYVSDRPRTSERALDAPVEARDRRARLLAALSRLGFPGMFLYWLSLLPGRAARYGFTGSLGVSDHASGVVVAALERVFPAALPPQRNVRVPRASTALALLRAVPRLLLMYRCVQPHTRSGWFAAAQVIYSVVAGRVVTRMRRPAAVLSAYTSDRKRIGLEYAAVEASVPTALFFLDRYTVTRHLPFRPDTILCFTAQQRAAYLRYADRVVIMPSPLSPIRPVPPNPRIALLLNARCDVSAVHLFVDQLRADHPDSNVQIRPHPGFDVRRFHDADRPFVADWRMPLAAFLDGIDLAFAPNSNVIIDALLHGVPTVYVDAVDPMVFDLHRFVADGLVVPFEDVGTSIPEINAFFTGDHFESAWSRVGFSPEPAPEREALENLIGGVV